MEAEGLSDIIRNIEDDLGRTDGALATKEYERLELRRDELTRRVDHLIHVSQELTEQLNRLITSRAN